MVTISIPITGCSDEPTDQGWVELSKEKVRLTGNIEGLTLTRATDLGFSERDTILLVVNYPGVGNKYVLAVWDDNQFIPREDIYYPVTGNLRLAAFYPYNLYQIHEDTIYGSGTFTYDNIINDPLVAQAYNLTRSDTMVNLNFRHSLSMVKVNISSGRDYMDEAQIIINNLGFAYDSYGNSIGSYGANVSDTITLDNPLIIPQQGIGLRVRAGDNWLSYNGTIPTESGKITNIDISVTPSSLNILNAYIKPWENGDSIGWDIKL